MNALEGYMSNQRMLAEHMTLAPITITLCGSQQVARKWREDNSMVIFAYLAKDSYQWVLFPHVIIPPLSFGKSSC
jgi:hypothetical protein